MLGGASHQGVHPLFILYEIPASSLLRAHSLGFSDCPSIKTFSAFVKRTRRVSVRRSPFGSLGLPIFGFFILTICGTKYMLSTHDYLCHI